MYGQTWPALIAAITTTILAAGRLTRLVTADEWPPILWAKHHWDTWTAKTDRRQAWWLLLNCHWCLSPWATLTVGAWAIASHLHWTWWLFNGWLALSYLTGILVHHDEGHDD